MAISKIPDLLDKIQAGLKNNNGTGLSKIELDILMQHLRDLYEELDELRNGKISAAKKPDDQSVNGADETLQPEHLTARRKVFANEHLLRKDTPSMQKDVVINESAITGKHEEVSVAKREEKAAVKQKVTSINESVRVPGSLNEKLKASSGSEVHKKLASRPLKDLIDLNKRFVLLNELFKGNSEAFSASVSHLDSLNDFNAAQSYIKTQLISNYSWDESSSTVNMFMKLVKQKFGVE